MTIGYIPQGGAAEVAVPVGSYLAILSTGAGSANVESRDDSIRLPAKFNFLQTVSNTGVTLGTYSTPKTIRITAGLSQVQYEVSTDSDILQRVRRQLRVLKLSRATVTSAATISAAQMGGGILFQDASGGNVTMTTRTGTQIAADFPNLAVGDVMRLWIASNHATNTSTIAGGTDVTLVGSGAVVNTGGQFLLIKTAATTFDLVRVG